MLAPKAFLFFADPAIQQKVVAQLSRIDSNRVTCTLRHEAELLDATRQFPGGQLMLLTDQSRVVPLIRSHHPFVATILLQNGPVVGETGATCTIMTSSSTDELHRAIAFTDRIGARYIFLHSRISKLRELSEMERRIVELAVDGVPNKKIATWLDVSIKTIEKYRRTAYLKLNVASAAEMASVIIFSHFCQPLVSEMPANRIAA